LSEAVEVQITGPLTAGWLLVLIVWRFQVPLGPSAGSYQQSQMMPFASR
jgi:hypothetical protein